MLTVTNLTGLTAVAARESTSQFIGGHSQLGLSKVFTFNNVPIGEPYPGRRIVVGVAGRGNGLNDWGAATLGGNAMTQNVKTSVAGFAMAAIYSIVAATGTTANIVVNMTGESVGSVFCDIAVFRILDEASGFLTATSAVDSSFASGDSLFVELDSLFTPTTFIAMAAVYDNNGAVESAALSGIPQVYANSGEPLGTDETKVVAGLVTSLNGADVTLTYGADETAAICMARYA